MLSNLADEKRRKREAMTEKDDASVAAEALDEIDNRDTAASHSDSAVSRDEAIEFALDRGEPLRLATLVGGYRHRQIEGRHLMLELGNPAVILLLAYLLTLPGIILEFFMLKSWWYFGFDLYSFYVFLLSFGCIAMGFYLLFRDTSGKDARFLIGNEPLFAGGVLLATATIILLLMYGRESAGLAILFSVVVVISLILAVASAPNIERHDVLPFSMYGVGAVIVALVPVHQAFGIWGGGHGVLEFTLLDGALVVIGVTIALIALNAVRGQKGLFSCWLIGAVLITLVSFHEIATIASSGSFEIFDQVLALEGAVFSLVPLALYFINEFRSARLWTYLLNAVKSLERKNYEKALAEGEKAMELLAASGLSNKVSLPWSIYGDIFYRMGKLNRAKTCYDIALEIDPNDAVTWSNMGNMFAIRGYNEQARIAFQKAAASNPNDPRIWNNLGVVFLSMRKYDEALAAFKKAIEKDNNFPTAYYNAGIILLRSGKPAAAMRQLEKLIKLAPEDDVFKRAYERTGMILDYFQQATGWKILGLDVSGLIRTIIENPGKFEETYREYVDDITKNLSEKAFGGDRDRATEALQGVLLIIKKTGESVTKLKTNAGLTMDQLRFCIAVLALANRTRFKTIDKEVRLISMEASQKGQKGQSTIISSTNASANQKPSVT